MFEPKLSVTVKEIVVSLIPVKRSERPALPRVKSAVPITCTTRCDAFTHTPPVTRSIPERVLVWVRGAQGGCRPAQKHLLRLTILLLLLVDV